MRPVRFVAITLCAAVLVSSLASGLQAAFPEYVNQDSANTHRQSGICTSDGQVVWDSTFSMFVSGCQLPVWPPPQPVYEEIIFAFMECYGGGMIDELMQIGGNGLDPASYTSAARENEKSWWANTDPASGGLRESLYNLHYSPWAGGATVHTHVEAATNGNNNDLYGPVVHNPLKEHPQYKLYTTLLDLADVTLHRPNRGGTTPDNYLAVLWGGSGGDWRDIRANYNSLGRIHADLMARGYTSDEIYLTYPSNTNPSGGAMPASWVVDDGTIFQDMQDAWSWVHQNTDANTQIYFWSNICHGKDTEDVVGMILDDYGEDVECGKPYGFGLTEGFVDDVKELHAFHGGGDGTDPGQPYFQVISSQPAAGLIVLLPGKALPLLEIGDLSSGQSSQHMHKVALDETDIANLDTTGNMVMFDCGPSQVEFIMAGVTTGDQANGVPEPASLLVLVGGGLGLLCLRRRRL